MTQRLEAAHRGDRPAAELLPLVYAEVGDRVAAKELNPERSAAGSRRVGWLVSGRRVSGSERVRCLGVGEQIGQVGTGGTDGQW